MAVIGKKRKKLLFSNFLSLTHSPSFFLSFNQYCASRIQTICPARTLSFYLNVRIDMLWFTFFIRRSQMHSDRGMDSRLCFLLEYLSSDSTFHFKLCRTLVPDSIHLLRRNWMRIISSWNLPETFIQFVAISPRLIFPINGWFGRRRLAILITSDMVRNRIFADA